MIGGLARLIGDCSLSKMLGLAKLVGLSGSIATLPMNHDAPGGPGGTYKVRPHLFGGGKRGERRS